MPTRSIGVDEAGRGAWAGPVVAGAFVILRPRFTKTATYRNIDDSKRLSEAERSRLFDELVAARERGDVGFSVTAIPPETIDTAGIKEANRRAMENSLWSVLDLLDQLEPTAEAVDIRIDGNDHYRFDFSKRRNAGNIRVLEYIRGDSRFKVIGAASIVAKVSRDRLMESLRKDYPEYGFEKHKGYGTAAHQSALRQFGVLEIHRKSYSPIKHLILSSKKL